MNPIAQTFALNGSALLTRVSRLALETKGAFPAGPAATVLSLCVSYCEAGRSAFAVLANAPGVPTVERTELLEVSTQFRTSLGIIATTMAGPRGLSTTTSLADLGPDGGGLALF